MNTLHIEDIASESSPNTKKTIESIGTNDSILIPKLKLGNLSSQKLGYNILLSFGEKRSIVGDIYFSKEEASLLVIPSEKSLEDNLLKLNILLKIVSYKMETTTLEFDNIDIDGSSSTLSIDCRCHEERLKILDIISVCIVRTDIHTRFEKVGYLGKGSFGKVYLCRNINNGKLFALKSYNKYKVGSRKNGMESIISEISVLRKIEHSHVVKIFEIHETDNSIYILMEYIEGDQLVKIGDFIMNDQDTRLKILNQLLSTLIYVNSNQVVHRDIKPENILLTPKSEIKFIDFGLSVDLGNKEIKKLLRQKVGTPGYIDPQIYHRKIESIDLLSSDLYSLALTFLVYVTGTHPFDGEDYQEIEANNKIGNIELDEHPGFNALSEIEKNLLKSVLGNPPENRPTLKSLIKTLKEALEEDDSNVSENDEDEKSPSNNNLGRYLKYGDGIEKINPFCRGANRSDLNTYS